MVWETGPGLGGRGGQNGRSDALVVEDDRLLDHHVEEVLATFKHAAGMRESTRDVGDQQVD